MLSGGTDEHLPGRRRGSGGQKESTRQLQHSGDGLFSALRAEGGPAVEAS